MLGCHSDSPGPDHGPRMPGVGAVRDPQRDAEYVLVGEVVSDRHRVPWAKPSRSAKKGHCGGPAEKRCPWLLMISSPMPRLRSPPSRWRARGRWSRGRPCAIEEEVARQIRPEVTVRVHLELITDSGIHWFNSGQESEVDIQYDDRAARVLSLGRRLPCAGRLAYGVMTVNTASVRLDVFASLARMDSDPNDEPTGASPA